MKKNLIKPALKSWRLLHHRKKSNFKKSFYSNLKKNQSPNRKMNPEQQLKPRNFLKLSLSQKLRINKCKKRLLALINSLILIRSRLVTLPYLPFLRKNCRNLTLVTKLRSLINLLVLEKKLKILPFLMLSLENKSNKNQNSNQSRSQKLLKTLTISLKILKNSKNFR